MEKRSALCYSRARVSGFATTISRGDASFLSWAHAAAEIHRAANRSGTHRLYEAVWKALYRRTESGDARRAAQRSLRGYFSGGRRRILTWPEGLGIFLGAPGLVLKTATGETLH